MGIKSIPAKGLPRVVVRLMTTDRASVHRYSRGSSYDCRTTDRASVHRYNRRSRYGCRTTDREGVHRYNRLSRYGCRTTDRANVRRYNRRSCYEDVENQRRESRRVGTGKNGPSFTDYLMDVSLETESLKGSLGFDSVCYFSCDGR